MAKATPTIAADAHRAVNWNEKAIQAVIDAVGYVLVGIKLDGMRCHLYRTGADFENVVAVTRAGHEILALREWYPVIRDWWDTIGLAVDGVLDTELLIPGKDFQESCGLLRRHAPLPEGVAPQFVILDLYRHQDLLKSDGKTPSYGHRLTGISRKLEGVTHLAGPDALFVGEAVAKASNLASVKVLYDTARAQCFEGVIVKDPRAEVRNGKVAGQWKLKPGNGAPGWEGDGVVIDYVWGEVGKANEGKIVGFRVRLDDGSESNATGLTQAHIAEYTEAWQAWSLDQSLPERLTPAPFLKRVARIEAMERTSSGSLRHPKFIAFRDLDSAPGDLA